MRYVIILNKPVVWLLWNLAAQLALLTGLEPIKQIYGRLLDISTQESARGISVFPGTVTNHSGHLSPWSCCHFTSLLTSFPLYAFPACSLNGSPSVQRWYFAIQACQGVTQVRHLDSFDIYMVYVARNLAQLPLYVPTTLLGLWCSM